MLIGELMDETGLSRDTLRYYERRGLIAPAYRRENGYREYGEDAVARLRFVRLLQGAGFTLREAGAFLELHSAGEATCGNVGEKVREHLTAIDEKMVELQRMRAELVETFAACAGSGPESPCTPVASRLDI